jgi:sensor histidine kinase regulating citrate/malate metabolism
VFKDGFTTKAEGHGYGLLSVKSVMDEYHGCIEVKNGAAGGAEFKLFFPIEMK